MNAARLIAVFLLCVLALPAAGAIYVPRAQVEAATQQATLQAKQLDDESNLVGALQQARWRSSADPLNSEAQMLGALLRLRDVTAPAAATRDAIAGLLDYSAQTLTDPVDVEQRRRQVPAFEIAAAARAALTHWQLRSDVAGLRKALADANLGALESIGEPRALAEVIATATPAELALLREHIAATPENLRALFLRLHDPQLALDALSQPAGTAGLALIEDIPRVLAPAAALETLSAADIDGGYASAARLALAPLVSELAAARDHLLATLNDSAGDSSAIALGRSGDAGAVSALAAIVADDGDTPRLRHALLGLRASDSAAAHAALEDFAADAQHPPALRQEVSRWLR